MKRIRLAFTSKFFLDVFKLALPGALSISVSNIHNFIATIMIGQLGEKSAHYLAAMGLGLLITLTITSSANSFGSGVQAFVSRAWGAKNYIEVSAYLKAGIFSGTIFGLISSILGFIFAAYVFPYLSPDPDVVRVGVPFLKIRFIGIFPTVLTMVLRGFFDGIGQPKEHFKFNTSSSAFCIVLSYILIFGEFGLPRMELSGFALASTLSGFFAFIHGLYLIRKYVKLSLKYEISFPHLIRNFKVAIPASVSAFLATFSFLVFLWFTGYSGTEHQAATFVLVNIISLMFLPCMAIGIAVASLAGRSIGGKDLFSAKKYFDDTVTVNILFFLLLGIIFFIFPHGIMAVFSKDRSVIIEGAHALRVFAPFLVFVAVSVIMLQSLVNLGDTKFVMIAEGILHFGFLIPTVLIFEVVLKKGTQAAWGCVSVYFVILFIVLFKRYRSDKWIHI